MDQEKIGVFISTLRKEQGMTQQQLADAIGVSNKTISKWECGKGMPELALIVPLATFCKLVLMSSCQVNICWKTVTLKKLKSI